MNAEDDQNRDAPAGDDPVLRETVRRHVGLAALRKLRHQVDAEHARAASDRQFVRRFLLGFALVAFAALVGWLWFRGLI
jgi:fatty acid desaturase